MKASLAYLHSPDINDLGSYEPVDPEDVGFLLQVMVGPEGTNGEESFDVQVCTPNWWVRHHGPGVAISGRHTILFGTYDWEAIERHVRSVVAQAEGEEWRDLADYLDRHLGKWEYASYAP